MLKLFWTLALPLHYIAEDENRTSWLIPVTPMDSTAWDRRVRYCGIYSLTRCLACVERFYQRPEPNA
jgi:hypothetical protein